MFYCDFHIARIHSIRSLKMLCGIYKKIDIDTQAGQQLFTLGILETEN